ncbi:cell wall shape-determining protein [uncultured Desulfobacterium sp.]|uniref:Peptidoglycan glycosyltransferase RodA n=1 Tax=uncultured Desulfobacterium sp. TaxID=201089 RepID=A0A445N390_9BACT|nr:cell wall shape-determining protein [uncultured Desulfobacterium sp.]
MLDRRLIENWDWILLLLLLLLAAISIVNLYSATYQIRNMGGSQIFVKQIYWYLLGFSVFLIMTTFNYYKLLQFAYPVYFASVALLILVLLIGKTTSGSQRWLDFGPISIQPSEFVKISIVLVLAKFFGEGDRYHEYGWLDLLAPLFLIGLPAFLILKQPDLGTTLHLTAAALSILIFVRLNWKSVAILAVPVICMSPLVWFVLKDYQKARILIFLNPDMDPLGAGYHINQSKIAIGSGQFWGKGFLHGTQTRLQFLPEQHTDFAFSVLAEEWGFLGSIILLVLYLFLVLWGLNIAKAAKNRFGSLLAVGIVSIAFWQIVTNVAMVTGLLPVVGIPLVLFSYGGSSIVAIMASMGLLMNISMRRFMFSDGAGLPEK